MTREAWSVNCGVVPYADALAAQRALAEARRQGSIPDTLLLLEHLPVYTKGRRSDASELPMGEDWYRSQGIEVCETDRGGRVTYHGPGQLVGYPIVDLAGYDDDVQLFVRRLERVMVSALGAAGVEAQIFDGLTGVWTLGEPPIAFGEVGPQGTIVTPGGGASGARSARSAGRRGEVDGGPPRHGPQARKIGAIGIHVSKGVTTHGFAVNVRNDLQPFEWIVPCGMQAARATSLTRELGEEQSVDGFGARILAAYSANFEVRLDHVDLAELARYAPAAAALSDSAVALSP